MGKRKWNKKIKLLFIVLGVLLAAACVVVACLIHNFNKTAREESDQTDAQPIQNLDSNDEADDDIDSESDLEPEPEINWPEENLSYDTKFPVISIYTAEGAAVESEEYYTDARVSVCNCDEAWMLTDEDAEIKVRGNSTAGYGEVAYIRNNQVPYRIKFDQRQAMLGLNEGAECKSWVLLLPQYNLIPDYLAFHMADVIIEPQYYSSDCTYAYVYINNEFAGLYLVCEQNQIDRNRVNISEPDEDYQGTDIGYLLELDNYAWKDTIILLTMIIPNW